MEKLEKIAHFAACNKAAPKRSTKLKNWIKCCAPKHFEKDVPKRPEVKFPLKLPGYPVKCCPIGPPPKKEKPLPEEPIDCQQPKSYRQPEEKREYLDNEVMPMIMEGMLALAREMPKDPISYLEKFWLEEQHKCSVPLPLNLL